MRDHCLYAVSSAIAPHRDKIMGAVSDVRRIRRDFLFRVQQQPPAAHFCRMPVHPLDAGDVLAACQLRGLPVAGILKDLLCAAVYDRAPVLHDKQLLGKPVHLIPIVGHQDHRPPIVPQHLGHVLLQPVLQVHVEGREGLVKKDHLRLIGQDPRQGDPLLLPAGQLSRQPV